MKRLRENIHWLLVVNPKPVVVGIAAIWVVIAIYNSRRQLVKDFSPYMVLVGLPLTCYFAYMFSAIGYALFMAGFDLARKGLLEFWKYLRTPPGG